MLIKGNVEIGIETRFGPNWPGVRCGAKTKAGGKCQRPAVKRTGRCTRHGGKSTGPRTQAGRDKLAQLHLKHGNLKSLTPQSTKSTLAKIRCTALLRCLFKFFYELFTIL